MAQDETVLLVAPNDVVAGLAAQRLEELGVTRILRLSGDEDAWRRAGFDVVATPDDPPNAESVDLQYHIHQRNSPNGSEAGARAYLAWEIGLVEQLDEQERASFRVTTAEQAAADR